MIIIEFKDKDGSDVKIEGDSLAQAVMGMQEHIWSFEYEPYTRVNLGSNKKVELLYLDEYSTTIPFTITDTEDYFLDVKIAHAEGKEIEFSVDGINFIPASHPAWDTDTLYRVKPEPKMYCRFKREDYNSILDTTSKYFVVGSEAYKDMLDSGWTECSHKTFEEIE